MYARFSRLFPAIRVLLARLSSLTTGRTASDGELSMMRPLRYILMLQRLLGVELSAWVVTIKPSSPRIRYDVDKLRHEAVRKEFTLELGNRFVVLEAAEDDDHDINSKWVQFSKAYSNTAENVLGRKRKSSKPWISPESRSRNSSRAQ